MSTDVASRSTPEMRRPAVPQWAMLVVIWGLLIAAPYWLPVVGGYTALAGKVLVFGLALVHYPRGVSHGRGQALQDLGLHALVTVDSRHRHPRSRRVPPNLTRKP